MRPSAGSRTGISRLSAGALVLAIAVALSLVASGLAKEAAFDLCPSGDLGGQCKNPRGLAVNETGNGGVAAGTLYLTDFNNGRIQSLSANGDFIRTWGADVDSGGGTGFEICEVAAICKKGLEGGAAGQFNKIAGGLAVNQASGDVYVMDRNNFRVQEFDATGHFVRAWGKDVDSTGGTGFEICEVPADCKAGAAGTEGGMFGSSGLLVGIGVDSAGDVYAADAGNRRIQKFDPEGHFLAAAGWDVDSANPSTGFEVCTVAASCQAGTAGSGAGQFSKPEGLAVSPSGQVYAADTGNHRVQRFSSALAHDPSYTSPFLTTGTPRGLAFDSAGGDLLVAKGSTVYEVSPGGEPIEETDGGADASDWYGLALNSATGRMYGAASETLEGGEWLRVFDRGEVPGAFTSPATGVSGQAATLHGWVNPVGASLSDCSFEYGTSTAYGQSAPCMPSASAVGTGTEPVAVHAGLSALHPGTVYHYRLKATNANGSRTGQDETLQTSGPAIEAAWADGVSFDAATLHAEINPEGEETAYRFQWGAGASYEHSTAQIPVGSDETAHEVSLPLGGLVPGTAYHWRVLATNPSGVNEGQDHVFFTYPHASPGTECPDQALRTGPSATLPDCRAYEMVSPVDKGGADIAAAPSTEVDIEAAFRQAAAGGQRLAYTSSRAFGDAQRGAWANEYLAERGGGGWVTQAIDAPKGQVLDLGYVWSQNTSFRGLAPDLSAGLVIDQNVTPLAAPCATAGYGNLYLRDNATGAYRAVTTTAAPPSAGEISLGQPTAGQAYSQDLSRVAFSATGALTADAAESTASQVYEFSDSGGCGELSLVSVLPAGDADQGAELGSVGQARVATRLGSLSADGSRAFWTASSGFVYVRINPDRPQSAVPAGAAMGKGSMSKGSTAVSSLTTSSGTFAAGQKIFGQGIPRGTTILATESGALTLSAPASENTAVTPLAATGPCAEPANACTLPVSRGSAQFLAASTDGSKAIYGEGDGLYQLDVDRALSGAGETKLAGKAGGLVGASEDFSSIYLTSGEALAAGAIEGSPNLYLWHDGMASFIVALASEDVGGAGITIDDSNPFVHSSRVTPGGRYLTFMSTRPLTGYDNADAVTGEAASEVYRYDSEANGGEGQLNCVSCNPSGGRPKGQLLDRIYGRGGTPPSLWTAAWIPTYEWSSQQAAAAKRSLSTDGNRVFFNSYDQLLPEDANGTVQDVYQWQAPGSGSCEKGAPDYFEVNKGCISLISSGHSKAESEFVDASESGDDVFFTTRSSLDPARDPGLIDIYDARVGGGFAAPAAQPDCEGDSCQPVPSPPQAPTPASSAYSGPANPAFQADCGSRARRARALVRRAKGARRAAKRSAPARRSRALKRRSARLARKARRLSASAKRCRAANRKRRAAR